MSVIELEKELEKIKERVKDAVGSFQQENYAINEKAKEGGYFVELDRDATEGSSLSVINPTKERLIHILEQQHNNFEQRNILLSETCDKLHSIAPKGFKKKAVKQRNGDERVEESKPAIPEYLSDEYILNTTGPAEISKKKILLKMRTLANDQKRFKSKVNEYVEEAKGFNVVFQKMQNEINALREHLLELTSREEKHVATRTFLRHKQKVLQESLSAKEQELNTISNDLKKSKLQLQMERQEVKKRDTVQSRMSVLQVKLQISEDSLKDKSLKCAQLLRLNNRLKRSLDSTTKDMVSNLSENEGVEALEKRVQTLQSTLFQTEETRKHNETKLKRYIKDLEAENSRSSQALLHNKELIRRMEELRVNAESKYLQNVETLEQRHAAELEALENEISKETVHVTVNAATSTESLIIAAVANPIEEQSPDISSQDTLECTKMNFFSCYNVILDEEIDELDPAIFLKIGEATINGFEKSLGEFVPEDHMRLFNIVRQHVAARINGASQPFLRAAEIIPRLLKRMETLESELRKARSSMNEPTEMHESVPKYFVTSTPETISTSVQTQKIGSVPVESGCQTDQKNERTVGTQAYLGSVDNVKVANEEGNQRGGWTFLTNEDANPWTLQGQQCLSPSKTADPSQMRKMISNLLRAAATKDQHFASSKWQYFSSQYLILSFWKMLCKNVFFEIQKDSMNKCKTLVMKHWKERKFAWKRRKDIQTTRSKLHWRNACDAAVELVKNISGMEYTKAKNTPKSERKPKKSPWDRDIARHKILSNKLTEAESANDLPDAAWEAVTLSFHPINFSTIARPKNYVRASNIHKFNKPHFDSRVKTRPKSSRVTKRRKNISKISVMGEKAQKSNVHPTKENVLPKTRPSSARIIIKNPKTSQSLIPKKKSSEVGNEATTEAKWAEPILKRNLITFRKGTDMKAFEGKRVSKNTYGKKGSFSPRPNRKAKVTTLL
jgi:hypothetical protein